MNKKLTSIFNKKVKNLTLTEIKYILKFLGMTLDIVDEDTKCKRK